ncbi:MAG: DNA photolyase [Proteobacteria bacterium]|nr:DNA photolyase [Pseudomonadota bacterium]MBU1709634.1 DNA photolyase [Pseudomonadota bacterium]
MKDPAQSITTIHVEKNCLDLPYTREILSRAPTDNIRVIPEKSFPQIDYGPYPESLSSGKKHLLLSLNRGKFLKPCPATREYRCCDYQVLNIGMNCPMDCVYCILQAYLNNPWLSFFVNVNDLLAEVSEHLHKNPSQFHRIGTGEFTDSMAIDSMTGLSRILIDFMRDKPNAVLELKTKTAVIDNLENLDHQERTIVAWSLNASEIMSREEIRTATLTERLNAAKLCASWGYRLAFHFDPIIYHPGWQQGYADTISLLFDTVPKEQIAWISMGCLRYLPALKTIAVNRFSNSKFFHEEFVIGLDGKYRYFRTLRVEMYKFIYNLLKERAAAHTCIYLCMESDEIWREVYGFTPDECGGLGAMLDRSVNNR